MDTKLKNRRKLGLFLAAVTILGAAFFMIYNYHTIYRKAVSEAQKTYTTSLSDREYLESFLEFSYVLYNQEISSKTGEAKMSQEEISDAAEVWMEDYEALYPYLDYRIEDGSGAVLGRSTANTGKGLADDSFKEYAFGMVLTYDEHGDLDVKELQCTDNMQLKSESGDVSIKRADLTDGQISLDDGELQMGNSSFNGDMEITSSNGDVSIQMKKSSVDKTNIYLKTTDGDVDTGDLSRGKSSNEEDFSVYENQVGTSAPTLSVKCSDGDIMLTESAK